MPPEPTPERVHALIKLVSNYPNSREKLNKIMVMEDIFGKHTDIFTKTIRCAEELELIKEKDGIVNINTSNEITRCYCSFRKHIAELVFSQKDTTFYKITEWYLAQNDQVISFYSWEDVAAKASQDGIEVVENDMLGWRWWASYLGIGYLHGAFLIPSLTTMLEDCLDNEFFHSDKRFTAYNLVNYLETLYPVIQKSRQDRNLGLGFSNGLLVLENKGLIEIIEQRDADRLALYPIHPSFKKEFSHIVITRGELNAMD